MGGGDGGDGGDGGGDGGEAVDGQQPVQLVLTRDKPSSY